MDFIRKARGKAKFSQEMDTLVHDRGSKDKGQSGDDGSGPAEQNLGPGANTRADVDDPLSSTMDCRTI